MAQEFTFPGKRKRQTIPFKCIKNLVVIPVMINGKGPFDFVLDTGVGPMIITDPSILDSLDFSKLRKINVSGLGQETVDAYVSQSITAQVGRATINRIPTAILKQDLFNLAGHLGIKVYGLLGFDFFNSFIVSIKYNENLLIMHSPKDKLKYRGKKIPIFIENQKPYVYAKVLTADGKTLTTKLLMDSGASHALSLEALNDKPFPLPEQKIEAHLGMSLSGQIKGHLGRIKFFEIGGYQFKDVISGFPDFESIYSKLDNKFRNGNVGGELLKKFNIQINYHEGFMYLKPNRFYKEPFEHDMTGMVLYLDPKSFKRVIIDEILPNSPADLAGLCENDEIIGINFKPITQFTLNDLSVLFKAKEENTIILEIARDGKSFFKVLKLKRRI